MQDAEIQTIHNLETTSRLTYWNRRLGALALVAATVAAGTTIGQKFLGGPQDVSADQSNGNDPVELKAHSETESVTIKDKLADMGLEHTEPKEQLSPEELLKQTTVEVWRQDKSLKNGYESYCLATLMHKNGQKVISMPAHCALEDKNGVPLTLPDQIREYERAVAGKNVKEYIPWEFAFSRPGDDPNRQQPIARSGAVSMNVGWKDSDQAWVTPIDTIDGFNDIPAIALTENLPEPGAKTFIVIKDADSQLMTIQGTYIGQIKQYDNRERLSNIAITGLNPKRSREGLSGGSALILQKGNKGKTAPAVIGPLRHVLNDSIVDGEEVTSAMLKTWLGEVEEQTGIEIMPNTTIAQFEAPDRAISNALIDAL